MISERLLRKWRKEALVIAENQLKHSNVDGMNAEMTYEFCNRILRMTQELLDQHLLNK